MDQFVCIRLVKANGLDLTQFQFDFDLTFAVMLMNADGTVYGRYGTRSEREDAEKDVSIPGLAAALQGALHLHEQYPNNKRFLAGKQPVATEYKTSNDLPSLRGKFKQELSYDGDVVRNCMHCHQIRDAQREVYRSSKQPIPDKLLFPYPMPDVVGLHLDPQQRATVKSVVSGSAAEAVGVQAGDEILTLNGQAILSTADVQWVLHHLDDSAKIDVLIRRGGELVRKEIELPAGWRRETAIQWRVSTWPLRRMGTGGLVLKEMTEQEIREAGLDPNKMALRVDRVGQYGPHATAKRAGFQVDDILVSFDGKTTPMTETDLLAYAAQFTKAGQRVPIDVLRAGQTIKLTLPMQE